MKKVLLICGLSACLFSCSLLQRHDGGEENEEAGVRDLEPGQEAPLFDANGKEIGGGEGEVARLNTKIAALETKLDVLTASMERMQTQKAQPVIEADTRPQPTLAAPVDEAEEIEETAHPAQISAAPAKPASPAYVGTDSPAPANGAEKEFRASMQLFQNGQNLESASRFALVAKKYPNHLLAGHALYWAGEASARGQQWDLAVENWSELEKRYPRSAYLPEALAGLAKAYETQGDATKGKQYRNLLLRSFPKSPIALRAEPAAAATAAATGIHRSSENDAAGEEPVPVFEDDNGAETNSNAETQ